MNHDYHNPGAKIVKFNDMALYGSILFKKQCTLHQQYVCQCPKTIFEIMRFLCAGVCFEPDQGID